MAVVIDCDSCAVRGPACADCVVSVLLGPPPETGFGTEEERALAVLADSGLVPRLRMVTPVDAPLDAPAYDDAGNAGRLPPDEGGLDLPRSAAEG
jgi:hypothetical protein